MIELWKQLAERANLELSEETSGRLGRYLDLLFEANQKMNLTRITDRADAELNHIADALTLLAFMPKEACHIVDVGSGGGVPGIPLAIARPDCAVVLVESTLKKAEFLRECCTALGLANVEIVADRAEAVGVSNRRETFDVAIVRAVATMVWLVEWCLPLVRKGGRMLAMKGPKVEAELPEALRGIKLLGGGPVVSHAVELEGTENRRIIEIRKIGRTDKRFPRSPTYAKGKPM